MFEWLYEFSWFILLFLSLLQQSDFYIKRLKAFFEDEYTHFRLAFMGEYLQEILGIGNPSNEVFSFPQNLFLLADLYCGILFTMAMT